MLLAAVAIPSIAMPSIAHAQETVAPPTVYVPAQPAPAPAPVQVQRPQIVAPEPQTVNGSRTPVAPGVLEQAREEDRQRAAERRAAARETARAQAAQSARTASVSPARTASVTPARADAAPAPQPAPQTQSVPAASVPPATEPAPVAAPPVAQAPAAPIAPPVQTGGNGTLWLILAGLGGLAALVAGLALLRRRRDDDAIWQDAEAEAGPARAPQAAAPAVTDHDIVFVPERAETDPVTHRTPAREDPVAAAPMFFARPMADERPDAQGHASLETPHLTAPDPEDIDAVLGGAAPRGDRPQLELAMRPMRAGTNRDGAIVEFELTVVNAGGVPADDVRIGAFMLSGKPGQQSEIERMLIHPPADAVVDAERIEPGDGTRLDAAATLPRDDLHVTGDGDHEGFVPVLIADARYRLPDGSEGRTAAAFSVGRVNGGEALVPFELRDDTALFDDIEARLESVPAKV
ncbi:LPXTG cell wall anchor domain-containing protein [Sphingomonas sp.]|uniref:LPXTG cell wall anchor domain-containing protein n=1 Tax=Sphingomonas sp. TaxID=28214 RepID=UPI001EBBC1FD|nr:LPXTG cell wall anchor domain-containing protein [Sphingomonas sp.]MBX3592965.1 LPXTG cell wall anchor domain-containing protein [Sphingomonas sp.]